MRKQILIHSAKDFSALMLLIGTLAGSAAMSVTPAIALEIPGSTSQATLAASVADGLRALFEERERPSVKISRLNKNELAGYYASRAYAPLWVEGDRLNARAAQALAQIARAEEHGLIASTYRLDAVAQAQETLNTQPSANARGTLELLASNAIYAYARDLGYGATPRQNRMRIPNLEHRADIAAILGSVSQAPDAASALETFAPQSVQYRALKNALASYRLLAAQSGWPSFAPGNRSIHTGDRNERIPAIRAILARLGDFPTTAASASSASEPTDTLYDERLKAAVAQFQTRHGLEPDGVIGPVTQAMLATPIEARIGQIVASLERLRWLPAQLGERYVTVNVPSYTLVGYDAGREAIAMRVIVGSPENATPIFSNRITDVTFNPSWGVPRRIAVKELLPKIRKDPSYLTRAGYKLTSGRDSVDPAEIDWENVTAANFDYGLRQNPGQGNALGKIKFNLPDNDDVYMHDTSKPKLFADADRAMSHGCVRLEKPREFARFVMAGNEGWNDERVQSFYDSEDSRTIRVRPVPVHLTYLTARIDEATGLVHFYRDVYRLDARLIAALTNPASDSVQVAQK